MSAFPTTALTKIHLDAATDDPSQARAELEAIVDTVNQIIDSLNQASGLAGLDASSKIASSQLAGQINPAALQTAAVETDKIADQQITFNKLKATLTSDTTAPTGGSEGDLYFIYET